LFLGFVTISLYDNVKRILWDTVYAHMQID
jgi:hypothetical protein